MPLAEHRDLADTEKRLAFWLRERVARDPGGAARDFDVRILESPTSAGFANETLLFDVEYEDGGRKPEPLIARIEADHPIFPEYDFGVQFRTLENLRRHGLRVPEVRWVETDPAVLGAPFLVAERVPGRVPDDAPPYHAAGWVAELSEADRAEIWWGGIDAIADIHALDWQDGFEFLVRPGPGTHQSREIAYWQRYLDWAAEGRDYAVQRRALEWLADHEPRASRTTLCWGDARIGNIIYQGTRPAAILDWEMATVGAPEMDLAWTLFLDWHHSDGYSIPRLRGLPSRADTIARYEARTGHTVAHLDYWEAFAAARFALIYVRIDKVAKRLGLVEADAPDLGTVNPCVTWLQQQLGV